MKRFQIKKQSWLHLWARKLHLDLPLLSGIILLVVFGFFILYSASNESWAEVIRQSIRFLFALGVMLLVAQVPPHKWYQYSPVVFFSGVLLLVVVLLVGHTGKGATRWLSLGLFRFQPSELLKLGVPMMLAWFLHDKVSPPSVRVIMIALVILLLPVLVTAKEPDLGTAIMIFVSGSTVLVLAGMSWWLIGGALGMMGVSMPILWHMMHHYQKERVLIFLNPERDPLGAGYHIIQSKIAIGSGGLFGKGWLQGTQSHLQFLPEHATDFIFAVCGEELGLIGVVCLLLLFAWIVGRCIYLSLQAKDTYSRLLSASVAMMFFFSMFVNIGMVTGILPVVGIPLPLISYGGTSMVTLMAGFGLIMSIYSHQRS